jgi:hypothetical protein
MAGGCVQPPVHPLGEGSFVTQSRATEIAAAVEDLFRRRSWHLAGSDEQDETLADGSTVAIATYRGHTMMDRPVTVKVQYEMGQPSQVQVLIAGMHDREAERASADLEYLLTRGTSSPPSRDTRTPQLPF